MNGAGTRGARAAALVTLAVAGAGCPPVPEGIDQTYEAGVAAGYAQALDELEALRGDLDSLQEDYDDLKSDVDALTVTVDDHDTRVEDLEDGLDGADLALLTLSSDLDVLEADVLRRGDLAIYPNETEVPDADAYNTIPDDGAWHRVDLVEAGCRFVFVKVKLRVSGSGPSMEAERGVWYAVGNESLGEEPVVTPTAPYGGVGSLLHTYTDAVSPEQALLAYAWVDLELERDLFVLITPDSAAGVGDAVTSASVAHLGCVR